MKKLIFTLITLSSFLLNSNAQSCGNSGPSACTPTGAVSAGFQDLNTVPCIERSIAYSNTIEFTMFTQFTFLGTQDVDSIEFVTINGLPCGICWATNKANNRFRASESGCIKLTGTTSDAVGQYKFAIAMKAWINHDPAAVNVPASLTEQAGVKLYIRVKDQGGACANVDTAAAANNQTPTSPCTVGIDEPSSASFNVTVVPNPMSHAAVVSFYAANETAVTVKLTDVTGKVAMSQTIAAHAGNNNTEIKRDNLPAGFYFLSLTDGKSTVTKRISITE